MVPRQSASFLPFLQERGFFFSVDGEGFSFPVSSLWLFLFDLYMYQEVVIMKTATEKRIAFRNNLKSGKIMITPGVGDALGAKIAELSGIP